MRLMRVFRMKSRNVRYYNKKKEVDEIMDYNYAYDSMDIGGNAGVGMLAGLGSMIMVIWIVTMVLCAVQLIAMWKLYVKAGRPGWGALVPFYNSYLLFDIALGNGWMFLTMLIPFANIYFAIKCYVCLAKKFGQPGIFALGLLFAGPIFLMILAFGSSTYMDGQAVSRSGKSGYEGSRQDGSAQGMSREEALARMRQQKADRGK